MNTCRESNPKPPGPGQPTWSDPLRNITLLRMLTMSFRQRIMSVLQRLVPSGVVQAARMHGGVPRHEVHDRPPSTTGLTANCRRVAFGTSYQLCRMRRPRRAQEKRSVQDEPGRVVLQGLQGKEPRRCEPSTGRFLLGWDGWPGVSTLTL